MAEQQKLSANASDEAKKAFDKREAALVTREAELEKKTEAFESDRLAAESGIASRSKELAEAAIGNVSSGKNVVVKRGDFIAYYTNKGGSGNKKGGWFKCSRDDNPTYEVTSIAVANEDKRYDSSIGISYHAIKFKTYKQFFTDESKNTIVSDGKPADTIDRLSSRFLVQPGSSLVGQR